MELKTLEHYWYILPDKTQQYYHFFCSVGVRKHVGYSEVLDVLVRISQTSSSIGENDWKVVLSILTWFPTYCSKVNKKNQPTPKRFTDTSIQWYQRTKCARISASKQSCLFLATQNF